MPCKIKWDGGSSQKNAFSEFTHWVPWKERANLIEPVWNTPVQKFPGVYLLAHYNQPPRGPADYLDRNVIYVGEGTWLYRRWNQFERSAYRGLRGHSGGFSYHLRFGTKNWRKLYVAALPIWFGNKEKSKEDWTTAYRLYIERRIIWEITIHRNGLHGLINKK